MHLNDFHFTLPPELIARYPLAIRSASRLLCLNAHRTVIHRYFHELIELVHEGDLLVFNDTKVIPARLLGKKTTGGQVEVLVERILDNTRMLAQIRANKSPRIGETLLFSHAAFPQSIYLNIVNRQQQFYEMHYQDKNHTILEIIEAIGYIPLPPYLRRMPEDSDYERYQTVYAKYKGSVAGPTAGFHFDEALLQVLHEKHINTGYLTLHIGAGTFLPVRVDNIDEHEMHAEYLEVPADLCKKIQETKVNGHRVIAVGTTSLRALETASQSGVIAPYQGETSIFIYPGYSFYCADALITNLHLPCSTLLMLVCAFGGYESVMSAYREAVAQEYRFYSYGDAMWVPRAQS